MVTIYFVSYQKKLITDKIVAMAASRLRMGNYNYGNREFCQLSKKIVTNKMLAVVASRLTRLLNSSSTSYMRGILFF